LTGNGYPRTTTSSHPNDNIIKTSAKSHEQQISHGTNHDQGKPQAPMNNLKVLEVFEISQSPGDLISNDQLEHLEQSGVHRSQDDLRV